MIEIFKGETLSKTARSLFFHKKGKATVISSITPLDILRKNASKNGRWNVALKPLVVALCPSDMAGGMREFPPSSTRSFSDPKSPAVAGHEFVGRFIAGSTSAVRKLKKKGIRLGDTVVGDINVGCGFCVQCKKGDPPAYCSNGATFAGVGSSPSGEWWVRKQTGKSHVPGAYTEGFVVLPVSSIHKVPQNALRNAKALAVFSQSDAAACAKTSCNTMGLTTFKEMRGVDNPLVLVIGAGKLGTWHIAVIKDILPKAQIFIADIKKENLKLAGILFNIPRKRQYLVQGKGPFSRKHMEKAFGKNILFDFIIDTAGHGVLTGTLITEMLLSSVANGGRFWTTAHTGIRGVNAGHPSLLLASKSFGNGLSPQHNFPYAISFLARKGNEYARNMVEIPGGLNNKELAHIVATGGSKYKRTTDGTILYSVVNS